MPVSLSLRKQPTFCDALTGPPPPENGDRETSTPIYHLLIMHYYPIISMK